MEKIIISQENDKIILYKSIFINLFFIILIEDEVRKNLI